MFNNLDDTNVNQMNLASEFLRQCEWQKAGEIFHHIWINENNAYAASRYLYCLRKAGFAEISIRQGKIANSQFPNNTYIRSELVWSYYDAKIKTEEAQRNLSNLIRAAEEVLSVNPDTLPKELVVFAVIKAAKQKDDWQTVSTWCDKLNPQTISEDRASSSSGRTMSNKEKWFFAKIKSLIELKKWEQARILGLEASKIYPNQIQFYRWSALALGGQGLELQAIEELNNLIVRFREEWYIFQDIGELYSKIHQPEPALQLLCRSALCHGEDKLKVSLYASIAEKSLILDKLEMAADTLILAKLVRQREEWRVSQQLQSLEKIIVQKLREETSSWQPTQNLRELYRKCHRHWQTEVYANEPRYSGTIHSLPPDKQHGWIMAEDGRRIFFLQRELPPHLRQEQLSVDFLLQESWDRRRGERSVRATDIQVINNQTQNN
jgi:tetratricopeptide (TPR) repeat protein